MSVSFESFEQMHKEILWPTVRVRQGNVGGSGTVIYSKPDSQGKYRTYVITCVPPQTRITTIRGKIMAANVKVGDLVLTHKNRWKHVTKIFKRQYQGEFIEIKTQCNRYNSTSKEIIPSLTITPEHPVLVEYNGVKTWVSAHNIKEQDKIFVESKSCECGSTIPIFRMFCNDCISNLKAGHMKKVAEYRWENHQKVEPRHGDWGGGKAHSPEKTFYNHIQPVMDDLTERGYRCIPIGHYKVTPDIIAIKDGKIIAVEVAHGRSISEFYKWSPKDKYNNIPYYDDVMVLWIEHKEEDLKYEVDEETLLAKIPVRSVETRKPNRPSNVYNFEVEEDNSYIAGGIVVHNCEHVVAGAIKIKEEWDSLVKVTRKMESREHVDVEFFYYENYSRCMGTAGSYKANIVAYDKKKDTALLEIERWANPVNYIANLFPKDQIDQEIHVFDKVFACGAALLHEPIVTGGWITFLDEDIEGEKYWMSNAATIFGNSGGSVFRPSIERKCYEFLGMPARIAVSISGFMTADAITHMGWFVPISSIYKFLESNFYQFLYDADYTYEKCEELRSEAIKRGEEMLLMKYGKVEEVK